MKLTLKAVNENGVVTANQEQWTIERGRKTIGRAPTCDWQILVNDKRISKQHCTISRTQNSFELHDQSANGTRVDSDLLQEGQSKVLLNGSTISMGDQTYLVTISGAQDFQFDEPERDIRLTDEPLTISAILSDITPNSHSNAVLKGASTHQTQWMDDTVGSTSKPRSISKNVQIGWSEPPATKTNAPLLPDDWNEEPASSQHEHIDALNIPVSISTKRQMSEPVVEQRSAPPATAASISQPSRRAFATSTDDAELLAKIAVLEEASLQAFDNLNLQSPERHNLQSATPAKRIEQLIERHSALNIAIENILRLLAQQLDPRIIAATVDQKNDLRAKIERKDWRGLLERTSYWSQYQDQFVQDGKQLSVKEFIQKAARGEAFEASSNSANTAITEKGTPDDAT